MAVKIDKTQPVVMKFVNENKRADMQASAALQRMAQGFADLRFTNDLFNLIHDALKYAAIFLFPVPHGSLELLGIDYPHGLELF